MAWRPLSDGDLFAPVKGVPPPVPEGYVRDLKNPFIARLLLLDCEHRFICKEQKSCGKVVKIIECSFFDKIVNQLECQTCLKTGLKGQSKNQEL